MRSSYDRDCFTIFFVLPYESRLGTYICASSTASTQILVYVRTEIIIQPNRLLNIETLFVAQAAGRILPGDTAVTVNDRSSNFGSCGVNHVSQNVFEIYVLNDGNW